MKALGCYSAFWTKDSKLSQLASPYPDSADWEATFQALAEYPNAWVVAVALGACIVEKHSTLSRDEPSPDSAFSLEPNKFKEMVDAIRVAEEALGKGSYDVREKGAESRVFRRSLFVVKETKVGEVFTDENVRSIRPGYGLPPSSSKIL